MTDTDRTNTRDHDPQLKADNAVDRQTLTWLDGLPHNFEGWGPKTAEADAPDDTVHADSELMWKGEVDERDHHVWNFQRAPRRHH